MISLKLTYYPFELKFREPFITSKKSIENREGILIKISEDKFYGMGECAPFPEFGSETLKETKNKLDNFKLKINLNPPGFLENLQNSLIELENYPALRHGIEQALFNLICNKTKISLNEFLNVTSTKQINVNAVMGMLSDKKSVKLCSKHLQNGFETIKVKVGRNNFEDDVKVIKSIRDELGYDFKIRIDANGKWNLVKAIKILKLLETYKIEYVEQPVNSIEDFIKIKEQISIPVAADESIRTYIDAENFINNNAADILILKPMMLGGLLPTLKIIELCKKNKINVVITSSFESSLGRAFAIFAASTIKNKIAHGLGTAKYFTNDIFPDPYPVKKGKIILN